MCILTHIMSESDATALDCTETNNIGDGAESAGARGRGRPPPRPISTVHVACAGLFYPPSGVNLNMRG